MASKGAAFRWCRQKPLGPTPQKLQVGGGVEVHTRLVPAGECLAGAERHSLVLIKQPSFTPTRNNTGEGGSGHMTHGLAWEPSVPPAQASQCIYVASTLCDGPGEAGGPH